MTTRNSTNTATTTPTNKPSNAHDDDSAIVTKAARPASDNNADPIDNNTKTPIEPPRHASDDNNTDHATPRTPRTADAGDGTPTDNNDNPGDDDNHDDDHNPEDADNQPDNNEEEDHEELDRFEINATTETNTEEIVARQRAQAAADATRSAPLSDQPIAGGTTPEDPTDRAGKRPRRRGAKKATATAQPDNSPGAVQNRLVINYVPGEECRVAVVHKNKLEELHAERADASTIVGNIYVGRVTNVESSIQAAFVDFGHGANGFLHVSDLHPQYFPNGEEADTERIGKKTPRRERPPIQRCLKRGQEIFVQVIKDGISTKGPTVTSYLSIPGRSVVMLPFMDRVGVSRKVEDEADRKALRKVLDQIELPKGFGFIARTAAIGKTKAEIKRDLAYLQRLWKDIEKRHQTGKGPRLLYAESDLLMRVLRDVWTNDIEEIVIDHESAVKRADRFLKIMAPRTATRLAYYDKPRPIFHAFGLERQIEQVFAREVPLPSGGSLVFDEAEALIAIDVNSGKSRAAGDAESNAFNTNKEAVEEICRQLKLRDVGGLVLCDLIDMMKRSNRREIEKLMAERLKGDRAATRFLPISDFGIIEMTRQRFRGSLKSMHFTPCPTCVGRAHVRKPASMSNGLLRTIANLFSYEKVARVEAVVSARVGTEVLSHKRHMIARLEHGYAKHIDIRISEQIGVDHVALYAFDKAGSEVDITRLPAPPAPSRLKPWEGGLKPNENWSVDAAEERNRARAEAMDTLATEAAIPDEPDSDELLSDDLLSETLVDEALNEGPANATLETQNASKKKRRRRRRGTRTNDAEQDTPTTHQPESNTDDEQSNTEGTTRKRRRRRRGRGGAKADDNQTENTNDQTDTTPRPKKVIVRKVVRKAPSDASNDNATSDTPPNTARKKKVRRRREAQPSNTPDQNATANNRTTRKKIVKKVIRKKAPAQPSPRPATQSTPDRNPTASKPTNKVAKRIAKKVAKKVTKKATKKVARKAPAKATTTTTKKKVAKKVAKKTTKKTAKKKVARKTTKKKTSA